MAPQVPVYAAAFFNGRFKAGASQSDAVAETKDFVRAALRLVQQQPYWARRGGSDETMCVSTWAEVARRQPAA